MRVLHLIDGLGTGGAERSLVEMLPHFRRRRIESAIACWHHRGIGVHEAAQRVGVPVRVLSTESFPGRVRELRRMIRGGNFGLVHTTVFNSDVIGRVAAAATGIPVLTSLVNTSYAHTRLQDPNVGRVRLEAARIVDGFTARHFSTWFHAITCAVRDAAVAALQIDPFRVTVIPRGRDVHRLGARTAARRHEARMKLGLQPDAEVLLNVGRQEFQKGHAILLKAAEVVLSQRSRAVLLIAGREGSTSEGLRRSLRESSVADRIRFLGHRDDIPELLCAADVFVFPSLFEGFGGALVEAMALETPIVASDLPAIREVVIDGVSGTLVPPGEAGPLSTAVLQLLVDRQRSAAYAAGAAARFNAQFRLEHVADRMADLLLDVSAMVPHRAWAHGRRGPAAAGGSGKSVDTASGSRV